MRVERDGRLIVAIPLPRRAAAGFEYADDV
jgi:hypothetical protein